MKKKTIQDNCLSILQDVFHNDELADRIMEGASLKYVKKKDVILHMEQQPYFIYILVDGMVRGYVQKVNFQELTDYFIYQPGSAILTTFSTDAEEVSRYTLQALEDTVLLAIPISMIRNLPAVFPEIRNTYILWLQQYLTQYQRILHVRTLKDTGRCLWIQEQDPWLMKKLQKQYVASYLDMTLSSYGKSWTKLRREQKRAEV